MAVPDVVRLQGLIAEYGRMRKLVGHTPQTRGQRFDQLIAEMLQCWGIEAQSSIRSHGEIDVGFSAGGVRYVVEAKWERTKADTGHVAKLQKRVRQRLAGTYGIFLAMSGFTSEALDDITYGERMEVLLLDSSHFEAMLSGLVPPEEMLGLVRDRGAFHAEPYTPLATLLASAVQPDVVFGPPVSLPECAAGDAVSGVTGEIVFSVPDRGRLGLAAVDGDRLLVTAQQGILEVDLTRRSAACAVSVSGCHGSLLIDADGAILFARRHGVARYCDGEVTVLGGGLAGRPCLLRHPDGSVWAFSGGLADGPTGASINRLGDKLGDEERFPHAYPAGSATSCLWLDDREVAAVGASGVSVAALDGASRWLQLPDLNLTGLARLTPTSVLTASNAGDLVHTDLVTGRCAVVARLKLEGSVDDMAVGMDESVFLAVGADGVASGMPFVARFRVSLGICSSAPVTARPGPVVPTTTPAARRPRACVSTAAQTTAAHPPQAISPSSAHSGPLVRPQPAPSMASGQPEAGWQAPRQGRANPVGEYATFGAHSGLYWAIVVIEVLIFAMLVIPLLVSGPSALIKFVIGGAEVIVLALIIGHGKMAAAPIRLEVGTRGIQIFTRTETSWFPWQIIDRVEIMRLEGGNSYVVAWCAGANMFPQFNGFSVKPRFLPSLGAVAVCPITVLRARRHIIIRAIRQYGGNRVGSL